MGDPITTLLVASTVTSAGAGLFGASQEAGAMRDQAAALDARADRESVAGSVQAARERRAGRLRQAAARAAFAESGSLSGTAFGVLEQQSVADELDALTVQYNANTTAADIRDNASRTRRQARGVMTGGYLTAAAQLTSGGAQAYGYNARRDPLNVGVED